MIVIIKVFSSFLKWEKPLEVWPRRIVYKYGDALRRLNVEIAR